MKDLTPNELWNVYGNALQNADVETGSEFVNHRFYSVRGKNLGLEPVQDGFEIEHINVRGKDGQLWPFLAITKYTDTKQKTMAMYGSMGLAGEVPGQLRASFGSWKNKITFPELKAQPAPQINPQTQIQPQTTKPNQPNQLKENKMTLRLGRLSQVTAPFYTHYFKCDPYVITLTVNGKVFLYQAKYDEYKDGRNVFDKLNEKVKAKVAPNLNHWIDLQQLGADVREHGYTINQQRFTF